MNDTVTHAASAADTQTKAPELKSTDTGVLSQLKAQTEKADTATPPPKGDKPVGEKPGTHAAPAENGQPDADSSEAEHQDADRKIEPWMRKRLTRAEEKGRRQALAELVPQAVAEVLRQVQGGAAHHTETPPQNDSHTSETPKTPKTLKTLADFDNDLEEFADYLVGERVKKALADQAAETQRQGQQKAAEEAQRAFEKRRAEFESKVGEGAWEEAVTADVDIPQQVVDLLKGHPRDLYIGHYLTQHPDELDELRGKSSLAIATALAAIDAKLGSATTPAAGKGARKELPPKITKAPAPPAELPSGTSAAKSIANMSTAERIAEWRKQKASRR